MKDKEKQRQYVHNHYENNKNYYYERNKKSRSERRKWFSDYLMDKCCYICGENDSCCLDHHHLDPTKKDFNVVEYIGRGFGMKKLLEEIDKCVIVCANCHRKIHAGIISL